MSTGIVYLAGDCCLLVFSFFWLKVVRFFLKWRYCVDSLPSLPLTHWQTCTMHSALCTLSAHPCMSYKQTWCACTSCKRTGFAPLSKENCCLGSPSGSLAVAAVAIGAAAKVWVLVLPGRMEGGPPNPPLTPVSLTPSGWCVNSPRRKDQLLLIVWSSMWQYTPLSAGFSPECCMLYKSCTCSAVVCCPRLH